MNVVLMVDGEHYPPAVRTAIDAIRQGGRNVLAAVFCGGTEKVDVEDLEEVYGIPVVRADSVDVALRLALERFRPDGILDCSDEPVMTSEDRFRLASIALEAGASYGGSDFDLRAPHFADVLTKPSISIFATGKRTGKTAVASSLARHAADKGRRPVIVAVGRGGPNPPKVIEAGAALDSKVLLELADAGEHASSDYVEDAVTSGVTTIGCMRVGGGIAGGTVMSNMAAGALMAEERDEDLVILEGSGASVPEVRAKAGIIVVPASIDPDAVGAYLNPYRLLLADLAVVTMAEERSAAAATTAAIHGAIGKGQDLDVVSVVFRPEPLADVQGRRVFFCTTAPEKVAEVLKSHLEETHSCEVVGITHHLADRKALRTELDEAPDHDVLLVELKAAAVDVAIRAASKKGTEVVFVNNALVATGKNSVDAAFDKVIEIADS